MTERESVDGGRGGGSGGSSGRIALQCIALHRPFLLHCRREAWRDSEACYCINLWLNLLSSLWLLISASASVCVRVCVCCACVEVWEMFSACRK